MSNSTELSSPAEGPESRPAERGQRWERFTGPNGLWMAAAAFLIWGIVIPFIPVPVRHVPILAPLAVYAAATVAFMFLQVWLLWSLVAYDRASSKGWQIAIAGLVTWVVLLAGANLAERAMMRGANISPHLLFLVSPLTNVAASFALGFAGARLSRFIKEAKILLPITVVAGIVDVVGAMSNIGFTSNVIKHIPKAVPMVSIAPPTFGHLPPMATVGPGDVLFLCFFYSIVQRFGMNGRGTFWVTFVLLSLTMLAVNIGPPSLRIAALLPMGLGMVIANFRYFKYTREETFAMIYAGIIVLAGAALFFVMTNRYVFHQR